MTQRKNKRIILKRIIAIFIFLTLITLLLGDVIAEQETIRDIEIKIILDEIEPNEEYTKLFRVENLDHVAGTTDLLHFLLNATILGNETTIKWNTTRSINKYTETGLGTINLTEGKYELCAQITPINFQDPNMTNNKACKTIWTTGYEFNETKQDASENQTNTNQTNNITQPNNETNNETNEINICDCALEIITEKTIYEEGETISFIIRDCWTNNTYIQEIEYWAEDLFGKITKTKLNTTSKNAKSYTPRIQETEKTFLLKARISNCTKTYEKIIIIKNKEEEQKETFLEINAQQEAKPGDTIIIELTGYKGKTLKTLITMQLELNEKRQSEQLKAYITKQKTEFQFKIPFKIPEKLPYGTHEYEITAKGLDEETKTLILINNPEQTQDIKPIIKSFYTRKQKFEEDINIIISWDGPDNTKIRITTQKETKEIKPENKTLTIPVKIRTHDEAIIAELKINEETKDIALLKLNLQIDEQIIAPEINEIKKQEEKEQETEETEKIQEIKQPAKDLLIKNEEEINEIKEQEKEQSKIPNLVTTKTTTMTKTINNVTDKLSEHKKQAIFAIIAITSLILLFKKEINQTIKKIIKRKKNQTL
jgi:hypothetical protein